MGFKLSFVMALILIITLAVQPREAEPFSGEGFEISGSGKLFHFETVIAGTKPFVSSVTAASIIACVQGAANGCNVSTISIDTGGKVYLFMMSDSLWKVSTSSTCSNATNLEGVVGGDGSFMMAGTHSLSDSKIILQGKVTLVKGTFTPTGIKGAKLSAVSEDQNHYGTGTVSAVASVPPAC